VGHHGIGRVEDRPGRTVVVFQRDNRRRRRELARKIEDVTHRRRAKAVNRLSVVADHSEPRAIGCQRQENIGLQPVRVLILIDQNVVELRSHLRGNRRRPGGLTPVQRQIIVIEHVVVLFGSDIAGKEAFHLGFPFTAPRESFGQRLGEWAACIESVVAGVASLSNRACTATD